VAAVLCLKFAGCDRGAVEPSWTARYTDSAGVRILTLTLGEQPMSIRAYQQRALATESHVGQATDVIAGVLIDETLAVVANARRGNVTGMDALGKVVFSVGRKGTGIDDFLSVHSLFREDSVLSVYDHVAEQVKRFSIAGDPLGTVELGGQVDGRHGAGHVVALRADSVMVAHVAPPTAVDGVAAPEVKLVSYVAGRSVGTLGPLDGTQVILRNRVASVRVMPIPFGRKMLFVPVGSALGVVDTDSPEVRVFGMDLRLRSIVRLELPRIAVTRRDRKRYTDSVVNRYSDPAVRAATEKDISRRPIPAFHPTLISVAGTTHGELWILPKLPGSTSNSYIVVSATAELCCMAKVPSAATLLDASERALLVRRTDRAEDRVELWHSAGSSQRRPVK
jgi:hypothetical protein